jgi:hypothetical protein
MPNLEVHPISEHTTELKHLPKINSPHNSERQLSQNSSPEISRSTLKHDLKKTQTVGEETLDKTLKDTQSTSKLHALDEAPISNTTFGFATPNTIQPAFTFLPSSQKMKTHQSTWLDGFQEKKFRGEKETVGKRQPTNYSRSTHSPRNYHSHKKDCQKG